MRNSKDSPPARSVVDITFTYRNFVGFASVRFGISFRLGRSRFARATICTLNLLRSACLSRGSPGKVAATPAGREPPCGRAIGAARCCPAADPSLAGVGMGQPGVQGFREVEVVWFLDL